jgi:CubicO group peptidase (beta-lactamase class C family)
VSPQAAARRVREAVRAQLAAGLAAGVFPGAVAAVARGPRLLVHEAVGHAQVVPRPLPMTTAAVFDLASLTKPVATTTVVLQLCAEGALDLDARVATYLARSPGGWAARATLRHLLAHTAGLAAWEMLYLPGPRRPGGRRAGACRSVAEAVARIAASRAPAPAGARIEYSDLGFVVLGRIAERAAGEPLDRCVRRRVLAPLGMAASRFAPPAAWRPRCAATEVGNAYERARAAALGLGRRFRWRTRVIRGQVHDGNAWYVGRGVAGHAGLFGTAADLARFGAAMLRGGAFAGARVLPASAVAEATRDQTPGLGPAARGLGWALAGWPFAGRRASPRAYGHTGFTGTSVLIDPARDLVVVLLTNRVHPRADSEAIVAFRPAFHDAVMEAVDG